MMHTADIRSLFLKYAQDRGHTIVPSASVVPSSDEDTLLFTNAGMVPFKAVFLGLEQRSYQRAASVQCCIRAGGKHNDLDNVGYTARHHTFFEMLGNFSFGDYFKKEAIRFAWVFLTEYLHLPPERLWITVHQDDHESKALWLEDIRIPAERISACGDADNFWSMGDTGPCGPCTEIFYDHGPQVAGGPPGSAESEGDRYTEIWNIVFMQYERSADGHLSPLPKPCVDTGMGLERLAAVLQGVHSNYEIDLFRSLKRAAEKIVQESYAETGAESRPIPETVLNILADHLRSACFLISAGISFSNEGRGYVLRRIVRRALRHGFQAGAKQPFFYRLVPSLVAELGQAYPILQKEQDAIMQALREEEERFSKTLKNGLEMVEKALAQGEISGALAFTLYDTYGFPYDLTADLAKERGLSVDKKAFEKALEEQKNRSRAASSFNTRYATVDERQFLSDSLPPTLFCGYAALEDLEKVPAKIQALRIVPQDKASVQDGREELLVWMVLDKTPFYVESGGQISDTGWIEGAGWIVEVQQLVSYGGRIVHQGCLRAAPGAVWDWTEDFLEQSLRPGTPVSLSIDRPRRLAIARHHSATHLLHAALHRILGPGVQQKGSWVGPERLRLDVSLAQPLTADQINAIETVVNQKILDNSIVDFQECRIEEAKAMGAIALFGEKYGERVRVLRMGVDPERPESAFSVECCGGTHVSRTGDLGSFLIISDNALASGVRRIEAVAGLEAVARARALQEQEQALGALLKVEKTQIVARVEQLLEQYKQSLKSLEQQEQRFLQEWVHRVLPASVKEARVCSYLCLELPADKQALLKQISEMTTSFLSQGLIVLWAKAPDAQSVSLLVRLRGDSLLQQGLSAVDLFKTLSPLIEARGGGKPDFAQGQGRHLAGIDGLLEQAESWIHRY